MVRKNQKWINAINMFLDGMLIFISYLIASGIRFGIMDGVGGLAAVWRADYFKAAAIYALFMVIVYYTFQLYGSFRFKSVWDEAGTVLMLNLTGVFVAVGVLYITRWADFSRIAIALAFVISTILVLGKRVIVRFLLRKWRAMGYNQKHVLVIGGGDTACKFARSLEKYPQYGMKISGYIADQQSDAISGYKGAWDHLEDALNQDYDEVVVALEPYQMDLMSRIIAAVEKSGTKIAIVPFYNDYIPSRPSIDAIGDIKLINMRTTPLDNVGSAFIKRCMDIVGSLVLIILTSPIMLMAAIGVKLSSPGPILFCQERVGLNKKNFKMYKFRSMRVNAAQDTAWSQNADPRKTKFGSFIRKTSIDELPQFFNVLKGDMSLIGPRPEIPFYVHQFKETIPLYMVRHQVRPGITGWAQVCGYRGDTSIEERIKHDIYYIENWSLMFDIRILFKTVFGGMINSEKIGKQQESDKTGKV